MSASAVLDTHVFLWWALTPERLTAPVLTACTDPATTLLLSTASIWEIQIKVGLGKLTLHQPWLRTLCWQVQIAGCLPMP
jgi:PIN domain nuclease of toxin-antitoxin system